MLRYNLSIGKTSATNETTGLPPISKSQRLKSGIIAFLALSVTIGVLIAAFVLGSVFAVIILLVVIVTIFAALFFMLWRRITRNGRGGKDRN